MELSAKKLIAGFGLLFIAEYVLAIQACPAIEYAQLKDSSQNELNVFYCRSRRSEASHSDMMKAMFERKNACMKDTGRMCSGRPNEFSDILNSQNECNRVAESVAFMLKKQFAAEPPSFLECEKTN